MCLKRTAFIFCIYSAYSAYSAHSAYSAYSEHFAYFADFHILHILYILHIGCPLVSSTRLNNDELLLLHLSPVNLTNYTITKNNILLRQKLFGECCQCLTQSNFCFGRRRLLKDTERILGHPSKTTQRILSVKGGVPPLSAQLF